MARHQFPNAARSARGRRARGCGHAGRNERRRGVRATDGPRGDRGGAGAERLCHVAGPEERRHARGIRRRESHDPRGRGLRADRSARRAPRALRVSIAGRFCRHTLPRRLAASCPPGVVDLDAGRAPDAEARGHVPRSPARRDLLRDRLELQRPRAAGPHPAVDRGRRGCPSRRRRAVWHGHLRPRQARARPRQRGVSLRQLSPVVHAR
jgi:hypothetical protein